MHASKPVWHLLLQMACARETKENNDTTTAQPATIRRYLLLKLVLFGIFVITVSFAKSALIEGVSLALNHGTVRPFVGPFAIGKRCPLANRATMMRVTVATSAMLGCGQSTSAIGHRHQTYANNGEFHFKCHLAKPLANLCDRREPIWIAPRCSLVLKKYTLTPSERRRRGTIIAELLLKINEVSRDWRDWVRLSAGAVSVQFQIQLAILAVNAHMPPIEVRPVGLAPRF